VLTELQSNKYTRQALVGLGGVGKSQIAMEYTHRIRDSSLDTWVFWVHAGSLANFEKDYREIAKLMRIPGRDEKDANIFHLVYNWLNSEANGKWVMVIDNADDIAVFNDKPPNCSPVMALNETTGLDEVTVPKVIDFIPSSRNGSILITSRNREVAFELTGRYKQILTVEPMNESEALQLLGNTLVGNHPQDEMAELVKALDYMPLAISQAGALITKQTPRLTIPSFIAEFKKNDAERTKLLESSLAEPGRDRDRTNSIVSTWHITFQYVRRTKPSAARLLSLMCMFDRQGIPETLLIGQYGEDVTLVRQGSSHISWRKRWRGSRSKSQIKDRKENDDKFDDDWQTLTDFSLIKTNADGHHFDMHRLVQLTTKKWLDLQSELQRWKDKFVGLMNENYPDLKDIVPHALAAITYRPLGGKPLQSWGYLMHKLASYRTEQAHFDVARNMYQAAYEAFEITLGMDDPQTLTSARETAYILSLEGNVALSETLQRKVLPARERVLGPEHPDTLSSMDDLGNVLIKQDKFEEGYAIKLRALKVRERVYGAKDKTTQDSMGSIALDSMLNGKHKEAKEMIFRENAARDKETGRNFDDKWCRDMRDLGVVAKFRGNFKEAEELFRQVYDVQQRSTTKETESEEQVAEIPFLLATVLKSQDQFVEAERLYRQALNGYTKARGEDKMTLPIMEHLAFVLFKLGKTKDARELCQKAYEGWEQIAEETDDNDNIVNVFSLAGLFYEQIMYSEALSLYHRALRGVQRDGDPEEEIKPFLEAYQRCHDKLQSQEQESSVSTIEVKAQKDIDLEAELKPLLEASQRCHDKLQSLEQESSVSTVEVKVQRDGDSEEMLKAFLEAYPRRDDKLQSLEQESSVSTVEVKVQRDGDSEEMLKAFLEAYPRRDDKLQSLNRETSVPTIKFKSEGYFESDEQEEVLVARAQRTLVAA
jgi:tetratricopeptide (TPR) repeat protein